MKKRKRILVPQKNSEMWLLFLACVSEMCRFYKQSKGPTPLDVKRLLAEVYCQQISFPELGRLIVKMNNSLIFFEQGRLRLTDIGKLVYSINKSSIIPPQTVAQPRRST